MMAPHITNEEALKADTTPSQGSSSWNENDTSVQIPLIALPDDDDDSSSTNEDRSVAAKRVVDALRTSGFLLVTSAHLPLDLQQQAIRCATEILTSDHHESSSSVTIIAHPTDPKTYIMLGSLEEVSSATTNDQEQIIVLTTYWKALEEVKRQVLRCIAIGLELPSENYFIDLHCQNHSALRLLHYPAAAAADDKGDKEESKPEQLPIRCKPHSDYGSITLLLTDGVPGLQALIQEEWTSVPHVEGALVVNIGSLLSDWTQGQLLATLHRVVGDQGTNIQPRTSLAFFADPDPDVSSSLQQPQSSTSTSSSNQSSQDKIMNVADYIQWRSGGSGRERSGLAFTNGEEKRAERANTS
jgi:isopenicillin N synthase-like dioxygenase